MGQQLTSDDKLDNFDQNEDNHTLKNPLQTQHPSTCFLLSLPDVPARLILNYLDPLSLVRLSKTNSFWPALVNDEYRWESLCMRDFPWFFWDGKCQVVAAYSPPDPPPFDTIIENPVPHKFHQIPVFDPHNDPAFKKCTARHIRRMGHPYAPLPHLFRLAYWCIYSGKYAGFLQILSRQNYDMCACWGVAKYDHISNSISVNFDNFHEFVKLGMESSGLLENWLSSIEMFSNFLVQATYNLNSDGHLLKRIPDDVITSVTEKLSMPNYVIDVNRWPNKSAPFEIGEEVEIQWGHTNALSTKFQWWRGYVRSIIDEGILHDDEQATELDPDGVLVEVEQKKHIVVAFNQFPRENDWYSVPVSINGLIRRNYGAGHVGGIRRIK
ncbi:hypothetical protein HK096_003848, partial [Nowakowskiella sp. JEL0078]